MPPASLLVIGAAGRPPSLRLDGPHLVLADDAEGENELSGWASDADADALAELRLVRAARRWPGWLCRARRRWRCQAGCGWSRRFGCGGLDPVIWCPDHGSAAVRPGRAAAGRDDYGRGSAAVNPVFTAVVLPVSAGRLR